MNQENNFIPITDYAEVNPSISLDEINDTDEVSFIPMSDVSESGRWIIKQIRLLGEVRKGYTSFQEGDVLFAKITPCMENGKGCYAKGLKNGIGYGTTEFHVLRAKPGNDGRFIFHVTQSRKLRLQAEARMTGSAGQQRVPADFFSGYTIPRFLLQEQTRIAEILSTADEAIVRTEALIAKYKRIKTGLMQDLLTRGIDEQGNIRNKATHTFAVKNGIEVPEDWDVDKIGNHCFHSAFGPRFSGSLYDINGNIGTLRTTDLDGEGYINYSTIPFANLNLKEFERHFLIDDDLLITRSGTVGIVSVFKRQSFEVIPGAFLIRFRFKNSLKPDFLRYYFRNDLGKRKLLDVAEGGVQKNIRGSSVLNLFVPIPSEDEQKEIIRRLIQIEKTIKDLLNPLAKLHALKTGLMQDLLSGEKRVKLESEN